MPRPIQSILVDGCSVFLNLHIYNTNVYVTLVMLYDKNYIVTLISLFQNN